MYMHICDCVYFVCAYVYAMYDSYVYLQTNAKYNYLK